MTERSSSSRPPIFNTWLILGVGMIVIGIFAALDNLGIADLHVVLKLSPSILIFMGLAKLRAMGGTHGYGLIIAGVFGLLIFFGHRHFEELVGPLALLALGVWLVLRALRQQRGKLGRPNSPEPFQPSPDGVLPSEAAPAPSDDHISGMAVMSGFKRRITHQSLRGGDFTAIFGGFQVDLRRAALAEGRATIDVFALFGGGEIKVPQDWQVEVHATAIAGGIEDKSMTSGETPQEGRPRLIVTGLAIFGGVEINN